VGGRAPRARGVDARAGAYVSDAETWAERRALYESVLEKPDTVLLLAFDGA
jgi:hypothetical protein